MCFRYCTYFTDHSVSGSNFLIYLWDNVCLITFCLLQSIQNFDLSIPFALLLLSFLLFDLWISYLWSFIPWLPRSISVVCYKDIMINSTTLFQWYWDRWQIRGGMKLKQPSLQELSWTGKDRISCWVCWLLSQIPYIHGSILCVQYLIAWLAGEFTTFPNGDCVQWDVLMSCHLLYFKQVSILSKGQQNWLNGGDSNWMAWFVVFVNSWTSCLLSGDSVLKSSSDIVL